MGKLVVLIQVMWMDWFRFQNLPIMSSFIGI